MSEVPKPTLEATISGPQTQHRKCRSLSLLVALLTLLSESSRRVLVDSQTCTDLMVVPMNAYCTAAT